MKTFPPYLGALRFSAVNKGSVRHFYRREAKSAEVVKLPDISSCVDTNEASSERGGFDAV